MLNWFTCRASVRRLVHAGGLLLAAGAGAAAAATPPAVVKTVCGRCHNAEVISSTPRSYEAWEHTVQDMIDRGATGADEQFNQVLDYLYAEVSTLNVNTAASGDLQAMLRVPAATAQAIITRRARRKFTSLADLKSIEGVNPAFVDARAKLIFF